MNKIEPARPFQVRLAVILLSLSLIISLFEWFSVALHNEQGGGLYYWLMEAAPSFAMYVAPCFFIFMIWKGRRWARTTLLILFLLTVPFSDLPRLPYSVFELAYIGAILCVLAGLVLLFLKPAAAWFRGDETIHELQLNRSKCLSHLWISLLVTILSGGMTLSGIGSAVSGGAGLGGLLAMTLPLTALIASLGVIYFIGSLVAFVDYSRKLRTNKN